MKTYCCAQRHLNCFLTIGAQIAQTVYTARVEQAGLLKCLALELDNVRHALEWTVEAGRIDDGLQLAHEWFIVFLVRAAQTEVLARMNFLLAQATALKHTRVQALALIDAGNIHARQAEFDLAFFTFCRAQQIGFELNDAEVLAQVYYWLATYTQFRGDYALARSHIKQWRTYAVAAKLFDETGIQAEESALLGHVAFYEGDYAAARRLLAQSYELSIEWQKYPRAPFRDHMDMH